VSGLAAAGALTPAPAIWSSAKAQARSETLLIVSEGGPNNVDIHGVGTNVPGYEVSWNCYDRLITHEMKSGPGGVPYYDRDKFKGELADDMKIDDMSVTFKLKKNAKFHDGAPVTAKDVKWSLDRAVSVGGFPTFQMGAGSLTKTEQFVIVDDNTVRIDFGDVMTGRGEYDLLGPSAFMVGGMPRRVRSLFAGYGYAASEITPDLKRRLMALMLLHRFGNPTTQICIEGWQQKAANLEELQDLLWPI
jgi:ABC-type transport system substrate-binding protein